jgi:hypothetical protein
MDFTASTSLRSALSASRFNELHAVFQFTFDRNHDGLCTHEEVAYGILAKGQHPVPINVGASPRDCSLAAINFDDTAFVMDCIVEYSHTATAAGKKGGETVEFDSAMQHLHSLAGFLSDLPPPSLVEIDSCDDARYFCFRHPACRQWPFFVRGGGNARVLVIAAQSCVSGACVVVFCVHFAAS